MPIFKLFITIINFPRLLFHILFFYLFKNKCVDDVRMAINHRKFKCPLIIGFCYLLVFDKTYRNLFYHRIGKFKYLIWYWLWPHPSFTLATEMDLGSGVLCIHPFATIVNANRIGEGFIVKNSVTIGYSTKGRPTIGDHVTINANAVVIGDIHIGNNSVIGAGTVLTKNVPDNCVVVGNPAHIIRENGIKVFKEIH